MTAEIECKIPVEDLEGIERGLAALGAASLGGYAREHNEVFDTPDGALAAAEILLRLRTCAGRPGGRVTVKRLLRGAVPGAFKAREEIETFVDDPEAARRQFRALGFTAARVYEKDRAEWDWRGARLALDRCPELGCFVEVEAGEDAIRAVLADLGIDPGRHIPDNYLTLWRRHLERAGENAWRDMVFQSGRPAHPDGEKA